MKTIATTIITILTLTTLLTSCRETLECEGFDTNHAIMDWYFAPDLQNEITYTDTNGTAHIFNQTNFNKSEAYTFKCGGFTKCGCEPTILRTTYHNDDLDITFNSSAQYYYPVIGISEDSIYYSIYVNLDENTIQPEDDLHTITPVDTFAIFNTTINNVFEIKPKDEDVTFWLKKNEGLIAFQKNGIRYKLQ